MDKSSQKIKNMSDYELNELLNDPNIIYKKALRLWGHNSQIDMAVEECAELISAINRMKRVRTDYTPVIEEIADVEIMVDQLRLIFGEEEINREKRKKLIRLAERVGLHSVCFGRNNDAG